MTKRCFEQVLLELKKKTDGIKHKVLLSRRFQVSMATGRKSPKVCSFLPPHFGLLDGSQVRVVDHVVLTAFGGRNDAAWRKHGVLFVHRRVILPNQHNFGTVHFQVSDCTILLKRFLYNMFYAGRLVQVRHSY